MVRIVVTVSCCFFIFSCKAIRALKEINSEKADIITLNNKSKIVKFVPMHHIGKPVFYQQVRQIVDSLKKENFIIFYEGTRLDKTLDSVTTDTYQRKLRKMTGFYIDSGWHLVLVQQNQYFEKFVGQPKYAELGISDNDQNVDIPKTKLIGAYEDKFGEIRLERGDYQMPLTTKNYLPPSLRLPKKNVYQIIIDYRNQNLAKSIQSSLNKKILVIYGQEHVKGTFDELKKLDKSWEKN